MKVLLVNKFLYPKGGSETYVFRLGEALQKMGHKVEYFGMQHPDNIVGNRTGIATSNMDFHGASVAKKLVYPFKVIYSWEARRKLRAVIQDFKPDVVHLNNINFQLTPSIIYECKKQGMPVVLTAHDSQMICPNHGMYIPHQGRCCNDCFGGYRHCYKNRCIHNSRMRSLLGFLESRYYHTRKTYALLDKVICPSRFLQEQLLQAPSLAQNTLVLRNFLTKSETFPSIATTNKPYVVYFGRYEGYKGIDTLLEACKALPHIQFVFAGAGPLQGRLQELPNVEDRGFLHGKELNALIAEAKFSICPSESYENCPFSVMESQMHGTPVIGSRLGGVPELIQDGETGLLFEAGNAKDLQEKIETLWVDEVLLAHMNQNCRDTKYDFAEEYCKKLLDIYASVGAKGE